MVPAADLSGGSQIGEHVTNTRNTCKAWVVMEAFHGLLQDVAVVCVVLACPWIFYQMWAFIGAGLYPHEKKLIHVYLPYSIRPVHGGCLLCQFVVMPRAVDAMLGFYSGSTWTRTCG